MENDLKGNENHFELTGGSSYGGFRVTRSRLYDKFCYTVSLCAKNISVPISA